jgi:murein DD-endopeptidase MepM/ murein hydrolase activator NlpD
LGRLALRATLASIVLVAALGVACSHGPKQGKGGWHQVKRGDTLWRIAQRYDTSVEALARANDGVDAYALRVGQKLWIPKGGVGSGKGGTSSVAPRTLERRPREYDRDCAELARRDRLAFEWPLLGRLTSRFGEERGRRGHDGVDLVADEGTPIRAAEGGDVVYADDDLGDYGKVVVLRHAGGWATVYAHNRRNLVDEGSFAEKGDAIAEVGDTGNASAPHLHFEVRRRNAPRDPETCLP